MKTAYERYSVAWEQRMAQEAEDLLQRRQFAMGLARRLAEVLAQDFAASAVYLFGSTAHGHHYRWDSDLDLAAEGIPPEQEFRAAARLAELAAEDGFTADLTCLESCKAPVRERVLSEGMRLV
ncbi:MAG: nucleotidyltransferase domain-containing protein [Thermaerobacter sp.]|nr:nucleotidyltransferase domain-containing protein [Thermaerobacter sp.]